MAATQIRSVAVETTVTEAVATPALCARDAGDTERAAGRHAVLTLALAHMRNHPRLKLASDGLSVALAGGNGGGKTTILEALSVFASGRGLRGARAADMVTSPVVSGVASWTVAARLRQPGGAVVRIGASGGEGRRRFRIAGAAASSLAGVVPMLWLVPGADRCSGASPRARRLLLDDVCEAFDPRHGERLRAYDKALRQRARLLRDAAAAQDGLWLDSLERVMAERASAVAAARMELAARLEGVTLRPADTRLPSVSLRVAGDVEDWLRFMPALAAEQRLMESLACSRRLDARMGGASCGVHRSDLVIGLNGRDGRQCSTGEQKLMTLAVVLAAARLMIKERRTAPLLLLDEAPSHLDPGGRAALYENLRALECQAWLTAADAALFEGWRGARVFRVAGGRATRLCDTRP